jgi:hypothetical protein
MTDKINLYVNSGYRKADETTTNLKVIVPSGLIKSYGKDYFTLSITSFIVSIHCIKWMKLIQILM